MRHGDVAVCVGCAELAAQRAAAEDRQIELRREVPELARDAGEQVLELAIGFAGEARDGDAREERSARGADIGVGGAQQMLALANVGALEQHVGRQARRQFGDAEGDGVNCGGAQRFGYGRAEQQRQRVFILRHEPRVAGGVGARGFNDGLRAIDVELRGYAFLEAALHQRERLVLCVERALCERKQFKITGISDVGGGDFGDQADLSAVACVFGGEILLQRAAAEAADAAEEIDLDAARLRPAV